MTREADKNDEIDETKPVELQEPKPDSGENEMTEINLDDLEQVKDENDNVLGYVHENEILDEDGNVVGEINADGDAEFYETEEETVEEPTAEADDADAEDEAVDMDVVDDYINVLHDRGFQLMDIPEYPSDAVLEALQNAGDEDIYDTQAILRELMDGLKDQIDLENLDTIVEFGQNRSSEVLELSEDIIEAGEEETFFSTQIDSLKDEASKLANDDLFSRVSNFADGAAGKTVDYIKDNPGKAAAVGGAGALALITGPFIAAGAGAAALFGGKYFKKKKEQAEDPLRLEAAALSDELKKMKKDGERAFADLEKAADQLDIIRDNAKKMIETGLLEHRRTSLFAGVMVEVERIVTQELLPQLQAQAKEEEAQNGEISDNLSAQIDKVNAANTAIQMRLKSLTVAHARGVIDASSERARLGALARVDMKIKDHLTETRQQWKKNIAQSVETLRFTSVLKAADELDNLSDNMQTAKDDMQDVQARLVNRTTSRAAVDDKLLIESLQKTKKTNLLLGGKGSAESQASRKLLKAAVKDLNESDDAERKKKLLPPSEKSRRTKASEQDNKKPKLAAPKKKRVVKRSGPK